MKNRIIQLVMVLMTAAIILPGCKKGEDDPFFSFRSRNARIVGEWIINELNYTQNEFETISVSNNVNDNSIYTEETNNVDITVSGTNKTEKITYRKETMQVYTDIEFGDTSYLFTQVTEETMEEMITINRYLYEVDLEVNKEGTYTAEVSETLLG